MKLSNLITSANEYVKDQISHFHVGSTRVGQLVRIAPGLSGIFLGDRIDWRLAVGIKTDDGTILEDLSGTALL